MMISVVTICFNEEKSLAATMGSVLSQTYDDFEYIIKDGGSTDRTLEIAEGFRQGFDERKIPFRIISGKDSGLYDAMNIAAEAASGSFVVFMNSGDLFFRRWHR